MLRMPQAKYQPTEIQFDIWAVWKTTDLAMRLTSEDGIVRNANPAFFRLFGYSPREVIDQSLAIIFPKHLRKQARDQYAAAFQGRIDMPIYRFRALRANQTECHLESEICFIP